ncbi:MAG: hypothetical protein GX643_02440 [Acidimicrobiales bacterium]|nr:hypothetical protein [Acidimicrobiales bacterium]
MGNFTRWFNYAKARLDSAIGQGNQELDELEAERERELADKPWLRSEGDAPTFDEAKARIEWQAEQAARAAGEDVEGDPTHTSTPTPGEPPSPSDGGGSLASGSTPITSPEERAAAAEAAQARLEFEARERESAERLDAIRAELGIDPPADRPTSGG